MSGILVPTDDAVDPEARWLVIEGTQAPCQPNSLTWSADNLLAINCSSVLHILDPSSSQAQWTQHMEELHSQAAVGIHTAGHATVAQGGLFGRPPPPHPVRTLHPGHFFRTACWSPLLQKNDRVECMLCVSAGHVCAVLERPASPYAMAWQPAVLLSPLLRKERIKREAGGTADATATTLVLTSAWSALYQLPPAADEPAASAPTVRPARSVSFIALGGMDVLAIVSHTFSTRGAPPASASPSSEVLANQPARVPPSRAAPKRGHEALGDSEDGSSDRRGNTPGVEDGWELAIQMDVPEGGATAIHFCDGSGGQSSVPCAGAAVELLLVCGLLEGGALLTQLVPLSSDGRFLCCRASVRICSAAHYPIHSISTTTHERLLRARPGAAPLPSSLSATQPPHGSGLASGRPGAGDDPGAGGSPGAGVKLEGSPPHGGPLVDADTDAEPDALGWLLLGSGPFVLLYHFTRQPQIREHHGALNQGGERAAAAGEVRGSLPYEHLVQQAAHSQAVTSVLFACGSWYSAAADGTVLFSTCSASATSVVWASALPLDLPEMEQKEVEKEGGGTAANGWEESTAVVRPAAFGLALSACRGALGLLQRVRQLRAPPTYRLLVTTPHVPREGSTPTSAAAGDGALLDPAAATVSLWRPPGTSAWGLGFVCRGLAPETLLNRLWALESGLKPRSQTPSSPTVERQDGGMPAAEVRRVQLLRAIANETLGRDWVESQWCGDEAPGVSGVVESQPVPMGHKASHHAPLTPHGRAALRALSRRCAQLVMVQQATSLLEILCRSDPGGTGCRAEQMGCGLRAADFLVSWIGSRPPSGTLSAEQQTGVVDTVMEAVAGVVAWDHDACPRGGQNRRGPETNLG